MKSERVSTRDKILRHGLNIVSTSGLSGITLGTLAEQVGMSKSGLFAHFGSKEDVQLEVLDRSAAVAAEHIVVPAMLAKEGLPRLKALVQNWLGWWAKAELPGGCPATAGMFELDDVETRVRERLVLMEREWRLTLEQTTQRAIELGHLRKDLEVEQFVWELCGIYLSHHASVRFIRDPQADSRAQKAFLSLLKRAA